MAAITLRGVEKSFGAGPVLRDCDLDIADHEFLVLVGPSGSGKTTLLRIISGLEDATDGDIYFGDRLVNDVDVGDRDIAMVFQNYGLYPHMSVRKNLAFGLRRRKLPAAEIEQMVDHTAGILGIEHLLDRKPKQLSGGQRQRVALGRAIVRDPAVFLLDEPLSNLDAHLRTQMRSEILKVHRTVTATAVYVTHDQVEALTMGDRIAVMHEGMIQQVDTPEALYDRPVNRFVAGFIGTPPMGFLPGRLERYGSSARVQAPGVDLVLPPARAAVVPADLADVVAGIRPEHLHLTSKSATEGEGSTLQGTVDMVEPLGSEQHARVNVNGEMVVARLTRKERVRPGENVTFAVEDAAVQVFGADDGVAYREQEAES
ncbi:MAG TPA: ABC transporter ATP-binding protein [Jiangellaceae bacterium]|nr:ABC transporter ATP-binding protein [Jiangellaceae bacterium]